MKALRCVSVAVLLISILSGQQVNTVDLTRPPETSKPIQNNEKELLPKGCGKLSDGVIADGFVKPQDRRRRDIVVQVISVGNMEPAAGWELQAEVQLKNIGDQSLRIPWSTDPSTIEVGQGPNDYLWDVGTFEFTLRDTHGDRIMLKSLTGWLYGSKFRAGSLLTLQPGEGITASVRFKLEDKYPIQPGRLKEGDWRLSAEWRQISRSWHAENCKVWNAYFQYSEYYRQQNPPLTIHVTEAGTTKATKGMDK